MKPWMPNVLILSFFASLKTCTFIHFYLCSHHGLIMCMSPLLPFPCSLGTFENYIIIYMFLWIHEKIPWTCVVPIKMMFAIFIFVWRGRCVGVGCTFDSTHIPSRYCFMFKWDFMSNYVYSIFLLGFGMYLHFGIGIVAMGLREVIIASYILIEVVTKCFHPRKTRKILSKFCKIHKHITYSKTRENGL